MKRLTGAQMHFAFLALAGLSISLPAAAQEARPSRLRIEVEAGPLWVTRNEVRIPPETGTGFSLLDLTGRGPDAFVRVTATFRIAERHSLRLLVAPVQTTGRGAFDAPVSFVDQVFPAGLPTEGTFKFNTYRLTYGYTLRDDDAWRLRVGGALLTRDAKIELRQGDKMARDTDLGFVPLAHFAAERSLGPRASLLFDLEGLGSPQGRALDGVLKLGVDLNDRWTVGAGYRTLEGGADVTSVYTFSWLHYGVFSLAYQF
jgi:hypothetical protein